MKAKTKVLAPLRQGIQFLRAWRHAYRRAIRLPFNCATHSRWYWLKLSWHEARLGTSASAPTRQEVRRAGIVDLRQEYLDAGVRNDARRCGLALACNAQLGGMWEIQPPYGCQHIDGYTILKWPLSDEAMRIVCAIDRREQVLPQRLVLDDPTKAL